jgi:hypothetical protein
MFRFLFLIAILVTMSASLSLTNAQTEERIFENAVPKHVPLKVRIKKEREQRFNDLKNDKWVSEFELEVTNTGDRPIYYLAFFLITNVTTAGVVLPDDSVRENRFVFDVRYGSDDFGDIITKARPDDVPIKPGETYVLTIDRRETRPWEESVREGSHPQATRIQLIIQILSFGDGTGLFTTGATPYPPPTKRQ